MILLLSSFSTCIYAYAQQTPPGQAQQVPQQTTPQMPTPPVQPPPPPPPMGPYVVNDSNLAVQVVASGLRHPTSMAFLGNNDILVLEKEHGTVRRIVNGTLLPAPLLDVNVAGADERGMLGIAVSKDGTGPGSANGTTTPVTHVFLYFTQSPDRDESDERNGTTPIANRLYKYDLIGDKLVNGKLLLELPAKYASHHNGGKLIIGPDNNLYLTVGDQQDPGRTRLTHLTAAQNMHGALYPDGTSGILRITQDGKPVKNILGGKYPIDLYYAYGIRNSFGIDFDPVTGKLWDTENGPDYGDEINLVEPGFNSGWRYVEGFPDNKTDLSQLIEFPGLSSGENSLFDIAERLYFKIQGIGGKFSEPEFVWKLTIAPTALQFLDSQKLGEKYENDLFVASFNRGEIYHFDLAQNRTALKLTGSLEGKVENNPAGSPDIRFATNFGGITDMKVGPDGYLYVVSFIDGKIYRILPKEAVANSSSINIPEFPIGGIATEALVVSIAFASIILVRRFYLSNKMPIL